MCAPWIAALVGAGMKAGGEYTKAHNEREAYRHQAKVADNNVQYAEWQAEDAVARGQSQEASHRLKVAQLRGTQRASLAARGVDIEEGSALNILEDTDFMGELDARTIKDNAAREAWGYKVAAQNFKMNADMNRAYADNIKPFNQAFNSFLGSAAQYMGGGGGFSSPGFG